MNKLRYKVIDSLTPEYQFHRKGTRIRTQYYTLKLSVLALYKV